MHLLVIGGLRDYDRSMRLLLSHKRWRRLNVEYIPFGWEKAGTKMERRLEQLKARIDALPQDDRVCLPHGD